MSKCMPRRVQRKRTKGWRMPRGACPVAPSTSAAAPPTATPTGSPAHADVLLELANPRGTGELENPYYRMWDKGDDE